MAALLKDKAAWRQGQQAGIRRVENLYTQEMMFGAYRDLYRSLVEDTDAASPQESNNRRREGRH